MTTQQLERMRHVTPCPLNSHDCVRKIDVHRLSLPYNGETWRDVLMETIYCEHFEQTWQR